MEGVRRGVVLVSLGSLTLVVMATLVKFLGERLPAMEIFFFRSVVGFFLVVAVLWRDPFAPLRTKRPDMTSCAARPAPSATPASSGR